MLVLATGPNISNGREWRAKPSDQTTKLSMLAKHLFSRSGPSALLRSHRVQLLWRGDLNEANTHDSYTRLPRYRLDTSTPSRGERRHGATRTKRLPAKEDKLSSQE